MRDKRNHCLGLILRLLFILVRLFLVLTECFFDCSEISKSLTNISRSSASANPLYWHRPVTGSPRIQASLWYMSLKFWNASYCQERNSLIFSLSSSPWKTLAILARHTLLPKTEANLTDRLNSLYSSLCRSFRSKQKKTEKHTDKDLITFRWWAVR